MPDIIIVEDNREIGTLLCDFLRKENYTVSLLLRAECPYDGDGGSNQQRKGYAS